MSTSFSTKCYYLPIAAGIIYLTLNSVPVHRELSREIPDQIYLHVTKALILVVLVFIICRIIDLYEKDTSCQASSTFSCEWCQNDNYLPKIN
jgi:hypothetical protein